MDTLSTEMTATLPPAETAVKKYRLECKGGTNVIAPPVVIAPESFINECEVLKDLVEYIGDVDETAVPVMSHRAETIAAMVAFHEDTLTAPGDENQVRAIRRQKAYDIISAVPEREMETCVNLINSSNLLFNAIQLDVYVTLCASLIKKWTKDTPEPTPEQLAELKERYPFLTLM